MRVSNDNPSAELAGPEFYLNMLNHARSALEHAEYASNNARFASLLFGEQVMKALSQHLTPGLTIDLSVPVGDRPDYLQSAQPTDRSCTCNLFHFERLRGIDFDPKSPMAARWIADVTPIGSGTSKLAEPVEMTGFIFTTPSGQQHGPEFVQRCLEKVSSFVAKSIGHAYLY